MTIRVELSCSRHAILFVYMIELISVNLVNLLLSTSELVILIVGLMQKKVNRKDLWQPVKLLSEEVYKVLIREIECLNKVICKFK